MKSRYAIVVPEAVKTGKEAGYRLRRE